MSLGPPAILEPRLVGRLQGTFYVPDYQRGYRWGRDEVTRLLEDISEAGGTSYYLQPVVVKEVGDERWELVDGQQRLTTLYLLMRSLREYLPRAEAKYTLEYQTRPGSAAYLDAPRDPVGPDDNIDYVHIYAAHQTISDWIAQHEDPSTAAIGLHQALNKSVFVIWYQAPDSPEFDSRALFTRLNVGRIPLTDAELVKASLLSRTVRKEETAAQWDGIERDLWSPERWAFIAGTETPTPATRIELLLDTVADLRIGRRVARRPRFHTFETLRPLIVAGPSGPDEMWNQVVDLHSQVMGWFDDRSLFHKIGYLIAAGAETFFGIVRLAAGSTRSSFEAALDQRIRTSIDLPWTGITGLTYGSAKIARVLLLMNVETVRSNTLSSERYSFSQHTTRSWSLEHIHAQRSQGLSTVEQWTAWLDEHCAALDVLSIDDATRDDIRSRVAQARPTISSETFDELHREIVDLFNAPADPADPSTPVTGDAEEIDSIANLALLGRDDNTILSNAVFEVKRRRIIELDQRGSYIPVCTRNVFLKYYDTSAGARHIHYWGWRDREAYLGAMQAKLAPYLLEEEPANDTIHPEDGDEESP